MIFENFSWTHLNFENFNRGKYFPTLIRFLKGLIQTLKISL